jgi:hypothetical protein
MLRTGRPATPALSLLLDRMTQLSVEALRQRAADAHRDLLARGITFTIYGDATGIGRILPLDLILRVITSDEWRTLEAALIQRVRALNGFLHDVYHDQHILADGVVPRQRVLGNAAYCKAMEGFDLPCGTYVHVCGIDIVRDETGGSRHMSLRVLSDLMADLNAPRRRRLPRLSPRAPAPLSHLGGRGIPAEERRVPPLDVAEPLAPRVASVTASQPLSSARRGSADGAGR